MELLLGMLIENKYIVSFVPFFLVLFVFAIKYLKKYIEDVKTELSLLISNQAEKFTKNFSELYDLNRDTLKNYMHKDDIHFHIKESKKDMYKYIETSKNVNS